MEATQVTEPALVSRRLSAALGAEVTGIDLSSLDGEQVEAIQAELLAHHVLFFPGQDLDHDAHVALGRQFGELEIHPHLPSPSVEHPEIVELRASWGGVADEWHTDVTFLPSPSVMSIMLMVECPEVGGDTMWANQHLAFEQLSPPLQEMVTGLTALHDAEPHGKPEVKAVHPVVRTHPETGRRSLLVNPHFTRRIIELSALESDLLLGHLTRWAVQERFTVRHRWSPGTVAMWDNRCTQHFVVNDFEGERVINRVTVLGDHPEGEPPRWPPFRAPTVGTGSRRDLALGAILESLRD
jgi:taurine dioxygenase